MTTQLMCRFSNKAPEPAIPHPGIESYMRHRGKARYDQFATADGWHRSCLTCGNGKAASDATYHKQCMPWQKGGIMTERTTARYVIDLIEFARQNEQLVQELYAAFAECIPEQRDFWLGISSVEARHVRMMESLIEHARHNMLRMRPESVLTIETVQKTVTHLQMYLDEVRAHGVNPKRAAIIAKEIEEGILEKSFDEQFVAETPDAKELLTRICQETAGHSAAMDNLIVRRDEYSEVVRAKLANQVQIELARTLAQKECLELDTVLVEKFGVPSNALRQSFSKYFHMPEFIPDTEHPPLPEKIRATLDDVYETMKQQLYVPFSAIGTELHIALGHPGDLSLRDDLKARYSEWEPVFHAALSLDVLSTIDKLLNREDVVARRSAAQLIEELVTDTKIPDETKQALEVKDDDSALVKLVHLIIEESHGRRASDIHVEPVLDGDTIIRCRVDGVLHPLMTTPGRYSRAIISRLKIMAGLDISEHRKPQSGKIRFGRWGRLDIELRLEVYPTANEQEDAVLRILASGKARPLEEIGLSPSNLASFQTALEQPYGLILCVGPTGSGKTTTLHSAISHINTPERKILTIEDPVEITQQGIRQVQVNRKAEVTFATALRSFLRSDPDVIMIGEMRDFETAQIALEASLTGHLVFSTLHTNTAPETVTRLLDMGLDPFAFSDALLAVLAQRLTRRLCDACKASIALTEGQLAPLQEAYGVSDFQALLQDVSPKPAQPFGCDACGGCGFRGRVGLHELMVLDDAIREMLMHKTPIQAIRQAAVELGMKTLRQDGVRKVLQGDTTLAEVLSVCIR